MFVTSRCDDVINVAGHRISTGAIEEVRIMTLYDSILTIPMCNNKYLIYI